MHNTASSPSFALPLSNQSNLNPRTLLHGLSQHARLISLETRFDADSLVVERFSGQEAMSELFRFEVDCLAGSPNHPLKALIGEEACLRLRLANGGMRRIHGIVTRALELGSNGSLARYRLTLEPWMHVLTLRRDSYVYQDMTVIEIMENVLRDYPNAIYRIDVKTALPKRSLTLQYRESDYAFIIRLLAEEGLNFFFEHTEDSSYAPEEYDERQADGQQAETRHWRHQLVVFDDNNALSPCKQTAIRFHRSDATETADTITLFKQRRQAAANMITLGSWDYKKVTATICEDGLQRRPDNCPPLEVFEGTGAYRYTDAAESARIARMRVESLALEQQAQEAESSVRALAVGTCLELTHHPDANGEYAVLSIVHEGANNLSADIADLSERNNAEAGTYRNQFTCISRSTQVRPRYWYPKPVAPGTQVALVVGVPNEEITTERDLRIKVQFPWQRGDRAISGQLAHPSASNAPGDQTAGTWVRVAEPSAGANWGAHFTPRIGQEVCIDFINGDIDRPVVTGQLYNNADTPAIHGSGNHPGALSGFRTKEYAAEGSNTWSFDDTPDQLRQTTATTYAASQLNVGYLIRQNGNVRGAYRGIGFELATDAWGTLRAKRGMFISTSQRSDAISDQLDTQEAQGKLSAAEELARSLSDAAIQHHAPALSTPKGLRELSKAVNGSDRIEGQRAQKFEQPLILIDSQAAVNVATPASSVMLAGQDLTLTSAAAARFTGGQAVTWASTKTASLFTHAGGMKVIAAKEAISVRAHDAPMDVLADKAITVTSSNAHIKLQARQEILLASGGGYIKLHGANIDIHCPASVSVKGTTHDFLGADSVRADLPILPDAKSAIQNWIAIAYHAPDGEPMANVGYKIKFDDGAVIRGKLDANGQARHDNVPESGATVTYEARPPKTDTPWDALQMMTSKAKNRFSPASE